MPNVRARIAGTGRAAPDKVLTNDDLSKMVDTSDEWIDERTGIRARRILEEGRTTSDLARRAGAARLRVGGDRPEGGRLHHRGDDLARHADAGGGGDGAAEARRPRSCPAFDISAACAGFIYGMSIADSFISGGQFKRVLVIGVEILSRLVDWTDRNTCVLFGDGAGAALLVPHRRTTIAAILSTHLFADGAGAPLPEHPGRRLGRADDAEDGRGQAPLRQDAGQAGVHARREEHLGGGARPRSRPTARRRATSTGRRAPGQPAHPRGRGRAAAGCRSTSST